MSSDVVVQHAAVPQEQCDVRGALTEIRNSVNLIAHVMKDIMQPDVHYGKVPGSKKPSLFKPGAEKICVAFRIAEKYRVEDLSSPMASRYRVYCDAIHQTTGIFLGSGVGECSSHEEKYRWRKAVCKEEFDETDPTHRRIKYVSYDGAVQRIMQVATQPADMANTALKMACKRAKIAMTLNVTAASDFFTQEAEDLPDYGDGDAAAPDIARTSVRGGKADTPPTLGAVLQSIAAIKDKPSQMAARAMAERLSGDEREAARTAYSKKVDELKKAASQQQKPAAHSEPNADANRGQAIPPAESVEDDDSGFFTYKEVFDALQAGRGSIEGLDEAHAMIDGVGKEAQRAELYRVYVALKGKLVATSSEGAENG